jgi:hypothetical protein
VGTTNSKPCGPIIMIEILSCSHVQFITHFFWRCTIVLCLLRATAGFTNLAQKNQCTELNRHILTCSHYILLSGVTCWAPLGDALKPVPLEQKRTLHMADSAKCAHSRQASPLRYGGFCQVGTPPKLTIMGWPSRGWLQDRIRHIQPTL